MDLRGEVEVAGALGFLQLGLRFLNLRGDDAGGVDGGLLVLPLGLELGGLFLEVGELLLDFLEAILGGVVLLLLHRVLLDFELEDLSFELIDLGRHGIEFHAQARGGFIHEIDGFVGQEAIRDVAMRERGGGDERGVLDADAVVDFVTLLESAQDGDGGFDARLGDLHGLEAAFERGVFFDVLAVLVERGGADATEFAAGELGLEHVRGVSGAFGLARADERVQFIDEEDDAALAAGDFLEEGFETILEFAAILRAGDHRAEVHRDELLVLERLGHVAADDAAGESLGDGGLAHAGFADEDGIVLGAAGEHLHDAANLVVAPDDGIDLALARGGGEVASVFLEGLEFVLGILISDALVAAQFDERLEDGVGLEAVGLESFLERRPALREEAEEEMLGAGVFVLELGGLGLRGIKSLLERLAHERVGGRCAGNLGAAREFFIEITAEGVGVDAEFLQERLDEALGLIDEGEQQMFAVDLLMGMVRRDGLRALQRFLSLDGESIELHDLLIVNVAEASRAANRSLLEACPALLAASKLSSFVLPAGRRVC